jgi:hypothetical protein
MADMMKSDAEDRAIIAELEAKLRAELPPEQWALVRKLQLAQESATNASRGDNDIVILDEMARHLPGLAPAIVALGQHLIEQRPADVGRCCAGGAAEVGQAR